MDVITQVDAEARQYVWSEGEIIEVCSKILAQRANQGCLDVARAMYLLRLFDEKSRHGAIRLARILQITRQVEADWMHDEMHAWMSRMAAYFERQPVEKKNKRPNGRRISHEDWEKIADLVASEPVPLRGKKLKARLDHLTHTTDGWRHLRNISESTLSRNVRRIEQTVRRKRRSGVGSHQSTAEIATVGNEEAAIESAAKAARGDVVASGQLESLGSASGVPTTGGANNEKEELGRLLSASDIPPPIRKEEPELSGADRHKGWHGVKRKPLIGVGEDFVR